MLSHHSGMPIAVRHEWQLGDFRIASRIVQNLMMTFCSCYQSEFDQLAWYGIMPKQDTDHTQ
jgi:hypothetical protein